MDEKLVVRWKVELTELISDIEIKSTKALDNNNGWVISLNILPAKNINMFYMIEHITDDEPIIPPKYSFLDLN